MHKRFLFLLIVLCAFVARAQELNCLVTINHDQVAGSNKQVFQTLEQTIKEYVNQTKWTSRNVKPQERINCAFNIIITKRDNSSFEGTIQVQSTRPVYGTSYETPVLNVKDNEFNFQYNEFDQFIYNQNAFDSNLISTITFYAYLILGADADTFALNGGQEYYKQAQNVALQAQQSGITAWLDQVGKQNRFLLIDNLLSSKLKQYRTTMYNYHRKGFDELMKNKNTAKRTIESNVIAMEQLYNKTVENYLIRVFFDAKADELVNLYSDGGRTANQQRLLTVIQKISPNNNSKWRKIK